MANSKFKLMHFDFGIKNNKRRKRSTHRVMELFSGTLYDNYETIEEKCLENNPPLESKNI